MSTPNTPPPTSTPDMTGMQRDLRSRLSRLGARVRALIALDAGVRGLLVVLSLLAISLLLDYWLELSRPMRLFYWLLTLAAGAHFIYHYGIKPLGRKLSPIALAQAVDVAQANAGNDQLAPRVATVLQLPEHAGDDSVLSGQMIRDAVVRSYESLKGRDFMGVINRGHVMQCMGLLFVALLVPGVVGGVMQAAGENVLSTWASRWLALSETPYPRNTIIKVDRLTDDGRLIIPIGEKVTLYSTITTKDGKDIQEARIVIRPEDGPTQTLPLTRFDDSDFRLDLSPMTSSASATLHAGDQTLAFEIDAAARPRLTGLTLTHTHPAEPDKPRTIDFAGAAGEVSLLPLNEVELLLTANVPIASVRHLLDSDEDQDAPAPPPIDRVGPNTFKIKWTHEQRQRLRIELVSEDAGLVSHAIPISVGLKNDRKPSVRLRSSGVNQRITPSAMIPLDLEARDDFGLRNMGIKLIRARTGEDAQEKTFDPNLLYEDEAAAQREANEKLNLEVDEYGVRPTDVIRLSGIATDARYVGAQQGESTVLTFRVVTHKELFREIITRQQQARAAFRQAIEDSKDIKLALDQAKTGKEANAQSRRFRAVQRAVWKVGRELERSAEEMRLNRLGGDKEDGNQAYESMKATILKPLEKLHDQTMSAQRDAIERSGNANADELAQLRQSQQGVIDDMKKLLADMNRWDELLDAINQLSEVIDQQEQLKDKLDELTEEQFDDQFDD